MTINDHLNILARIFVAAFACSFFILLATGFFVLCCYAIRFLHNQLDPWFFSVSMIFVALVLVFSVWAAWPEWYRPWSPGPHTIEECAKQCGSPERISRFAPYRQACECTNGSK